MHIEVIAIPGEVKAIAGKLGVLTQAVKTALQSNVAIGATALIDMYYPDAGALRTELIALCEKAITTCQLIQAADWSGVTARLQRLVADSTAILHGKQHGISVYIQWVEVEIRDLLDKQA